MAYTDYQKALKLGEKAYKQAASQGAYPYLPVLEDMILAEKHMAQVKLGLEEIPIELIVGTYTSGRTNAFSCDFMPLLPSDTEFASKWSDLYDSLCDKGQRDPVVAFEYMNRFYIVEGNKRVSVQKYMGAVSIEGTVTRLVPQKSDDNRIYYEFLDFYAKTKINYLLMSKEGAYEKLYRHIHPDDDTPLTEDEQLDIKYIYCCFKKAYLEKGGDKLNATIGDQLLTYINLYTYEEVKNQSSAEIKKNISKIWSEFVMLSDKKPLSMVMNPTDDSQKITFPHILSNVGQILNPGALLKVAFVYFKKPEVSGWTYAHEVGRKEVQRILNDKIQTEAFVMNDSSDDSFIESLIADGFKVIFTTTPVLSSVSLRCAVNHPEIVIINCSLNNAFRHLRTYYLRVYEAKFIIGAIAGSMTETNKIGYIADYPIFGMPAAVNAFAIGARMTNPSAHIYVDWSSLKDGTDPVERIMKKFDIDIVSNRDIVPFPENSNKKHGLYGLYGNYSFMIARPVWNWSVVYESLIRSVLNGVWKNDENASGGHGLNYYWGMSSNAIDIITSDDDENTENDLPIGTRQLIYILSEMIKDGKMNPFSSEIKNQHDDTVNEDGNCMTPEQIINMDWFADNVTGSIPDISEFTEESRELISKLGIKLNTGEKK